MPNSFLSLFWGIKMPCSHQSKYQWDWKLVVGLIALVGHQFLACELTSLSRLRLKYSDEIYGWRRRGLLNSPPPCSPALPVISGFDSLVSLAPCTRTEGMPAELIAMPGPGYGSFPTCFQPVCLSTCPHFYPPGMCWSPPVFTFAAKLWKNCTPRVPRWYRQNPSKWLPSFPVNCIPSTSDLDWKGLPGAHEFSCVPVLSLHAALVDLYCCFPDVCRVM